MAFEVVSGKEKKAVIISSEICMMLPLVQLRRINSIKWLLHILLRISPNPSLPFWLITYLHASFFFHKYCTMHCHIWMSFLFGFWSFWFLTVSLNSSPWWFTNLPAWCLTFQPTLLCPLSCSLKCWLQLCSGKALAGARIKIDTKFLRCDPSNCISTKLGALYLYQCPLTCFCEYHVVLLKTLLKSRNIWI